MPSDISDRWLWLGVGILALVAAKGITYALTDLVRVTEIDADQYPPVPAGPKEQLPEDTISLATCKLLCQSPNSSIASVAHSLLIKRFASLPDAVQILTHDAQSSNERVQRQARQAVQFLRDYECEMHETLPLPLQYADDLIYRGEFGNMRNTRREEWDAFAENRGQGRSSRDSDVVARLDELSDEIDRIESRWRAITSGQARVTTWDRPRARGEDEAETRRRRREAMVFREGGGRIEEEDIFRPVRTVSE